MSDPYQALGVSAAAGDEEITRAYRQLARKYHPDMNPGDRAAEARMKEINAAYEQIKDIRAGKSTYHAGGDAENAGARQGGFSYGDPFSGPFGGFAGSPFGSYYGSRREPGQTYGTGGSRPYRGRGRQPIFFRVFLIIIVLRLLLSCFSCMGQLLSGNGYGDAYPYNRDYGADFYNSQGGDTPYHNTAEE